MKKNVKRHRCVNMDDITHHQCMELADNFGLSFSGALRLIIRQAYLQRPHIVFKGAENRISSSLQQHHQ
jgi:hypothetical protein